VGILATVSSIDRPRRRAKVSWTRAFRPVGRWLAV